MPTISDWLLMLLAVSYLVIAITETEGPAGIFEKARGIRFVGKLFECPICASIWLALLVLWLYPQLPFLIMAIALAGIFVVMGRIWERATGWRKLRDERERLENAENLLSNLMTLNDEAKAQAVLNHYLSGLDLSVAVFLGMRDEKQEPAELS